MNIRKKRALLSAQLKENMSLLEKSIEALLYSYEKCRLIIQKSEYDLEEQESFEAITSRFARTSDILTQKVFKGLFVFLQENIKTIIDAANLLEKLEIVENADTILNIRELRNQIAHEYVTTDLNSLYMDILVTVPELLKVVENLKAYLANNKVT